MRFMRLLCLLVLVACTGIPRADESSSGSVIHPLDQTIWDIASGRSLDRAELAERAAASDIVVLGEVHDNPAHHQAQAWMVRRLRPEGLAFEMIPKASEEGVQVFLAQGGSPGEIGPAIGWERIGWPDWKMYRPIFEASAATVYTGGGVARSAIRAAISDGAASVPPSAEFAPVLAAALDPATQTAMEDEMVASHCGKLPRAAAPGMVEAQRLRDASFAAATLRAHVATDGGRTALITGNGHARNDTGVPAYLSDAAPDLAVISIGLIETAPEGRSLSDYSPLPYDYVWFTAPAEREDPCDRFE